MSRTLGNRLATVNRNSSRRRTVHTGTRRRVVATSGNSALRAAGLNPGLRYITVANKCWAVDQTPAAETIVLVNSTVHVTIAQDNPDCQPV